MTITQADREAADNAVAEAAIDIANGNHGGTDWLAKLFAAHRIAALEEAARVCEEQQQTFLSPEYATGQPMSSFGERFACGRCAEAIRNLAGEE